LDEFRLTALVIEIFIAKDKFAAGAGALPGYPKSTGMAKMKKSGRGGCEPATVCAHG
jgi:hypothetical protein